MVAVPTLSCALIEAYTAPGWEIGRLRYGAAVQQITVNVPLTVRREGGHQHPDGEHRRLPGTMS